MDQGYLATNQDVTEQPLTELLDELAPTEKTNTSQQPITLLSLIKHLGLQGKNRQGTQLLMPQNHRNCKAIDVNHHVFPCNQKAILEGLCTEHRQQLNSFIDVHFSWHKWPAQIKEQGLAVITFLKALRFSDGKMSTDEALLFLSQITPTLSQFNMQIHTVQFQLDNHTRNIQLTDKMTEIYLENLPRALFLALTSERAFSDNTTFSTSNGWIYRASNTTWYLFLLWKNMGIIPDFLVWQAAMTLKKSIGL